jgi:hypothetical protein
VKILNRPAAVSSAKVFEQYSFHCPENLISALCKENRDGKDAQRRSKSEDLPNGYGYKAFVE